MYDIYFMMPHCQIFEPSVVTHIYPTLTLSFAMCAYFYYFIANVNHYSAEMSDGICKRKHYAYFNRQNFEF